MPIVSRCPRATSCGADGSDRPAAQNHGQDPRPSSLGICRGHRQTGRWVRGRGVKRRFSLQAGGAKLKTSTTILPGFSLPRRLQSAVHVVREDEYLGSGVGAADADMAGLASVAEGDGADGPDLVGADAVMGVGVAVAGSGLGPFGIGGCGGLVAGQGAVRPVVVVGGGELAGQGWRADCDRPSWLVRPATCQAGSARPALRPGIRPRSQRRACRRMPGRMTGCSGRASLSGRRSRP
jgi:hypothetical protein